MIVGVTGFFCSGKDTVASVLQAKGFEHISLSDMIREEIQARGRRITIPLMTEVGNELRRQGGPGILAQRALARIEHHPQLGGHLHPPPQRSPGPAGAARFHDGLCGRRPEGAL